jgi:hypothetical protein
MPSTTAQSLLRATTATFEELALLFPETDLSPDQAEAPLDIAVSVDFRGPLTGRLIVRASSCILPAIAANMLGESESEQLQRDALGEIGNVICGNVLPLMAGTEKIFNLSAPQVYGGDFVVHRDEDAPSARIQIGVEEGRVESTLYVFDSASVVAEPATSA